MSGTIGFINQDGIKGFIMNHKDNIERLRCSITNGIASLVYTEYIAKSEMKSMPVERLLVPSIKRVSDVVDISSLLMKEVSKNVITRIISDEWPKQISMFKESEDMLIPSNMEIMQQVLDRYILPKIGMVIPSAIRRKFGIGTDNAVATEDYGLDIFPRGITDDMIWYIVNASILGYVVCLHEPILLVDISGSPEIVVDENTILSIDHNNALCRILFTTDMFVRSEMNHIFSKPTVTRWNLAPDDHNKYNVYTSKQNEVKVIRYI